VARAPKRPPPPVSRNRSGVEDPIGKPDEHELADPNKRYRRDPIPDEDPPTRKPSETDIFLGDAIDKGRDEIFGRDPGPYGRFQYNSKRLAARTAGAKMSTLMRR
jgi:hypothetical protein